MGDETWFRGEGGVPPSRPGGDPHDLGDGVYFTDTEGVAWQYAKTRAPQPKDQRVWQITVDRLTVGRVLDLTMDSRWQKFITEPMLPGSTNPNLKKSRLDYLRINNENYGQFFEEFLLRNKIDIKSYDAVVGHEYVRGGKQLCLLHKNGRPTLLQARFRALLRPVRWAVRVANVGGRSTAVRAGQPAPKAISYPRAVGGMIVSVGIALFLSYLSQRLMQAINDSIIKNRMGKIGPEIQKFGTAHKFIMLDNMISGGRAYVTASVRIEYNNVPNTLDTTSVSYFQNPASVNLETLAITDADRSSPVTHTTDASIFGGGTWQDIYLYTFSTEAQIAKEEIDWYKDLREQVKWLESTSSRKNVLLTDADRKKLKIELSALYDLITEMFARPEFVADRALWTSDGYGRITTGVP